MGFLGKLGHRQKEISDQGETDGVQTGWDALRKKVATTWDDLRGVKFAGDEPAQNEMGGCL